MRSIAVLVLSVSSALLPAVLRAQDPGTSYHFRIPAPLPPGLQQHLAQEFDVLPGPWPDGSAHVVVMPEELVRFGKLAERAVLVERGRPFRDIVRAAPAAPDPNYYTVAEIEQKIDQLVAAYPAIAMKVDLTALPGASKTHNGQAIWALKVSDNVAQDEDEPAILVAAQHHARELNAPIMVIGAMERILQAYATDPALQALVDQTELYFVPCVNPDGVDWVWNNDNLWRKNRRNNGGGVFGVDNNRNYPVRWGQCGASTQTSSDVYQGPSAGSEPETQTMIAVQRALRPALYLDFHSYGQDVLSTYAPCATANPTIQAFVDRYVNDVRAVLSYSSRAPSGSGEAPENHWNTGGTLSFLIEVGTAFQPPWSQTQTEEARVWPGVRQALTKWHPALQGHVRSILGLQPLEATISFTPNLFTAGEKTVGRARDGRYALWLPLGTWQVTFAATGFRSFTTQVSVTSYDQPLAYEVELIPNFADATIGKQGTDRIGTTTTFTYTSPGDAGDTYWVALALGDMPGIALVSRTVPLNADSLFFASAVPGRLLLNNLGVLPASQQASASFPIPPLSILIGLKLYAGGITLSPAYSSLVKKFSTSLPLVIQP